VDEEDPAFWTSPPIARPRRSTVHRLAGSLVVVAFVALVVWGVGVRRGWSGLDQATKAQVERDLSAQATRIAGHPARRSL